jgi:hypothetical protein
MLSFPKESFGLPVQLSFSVRIDPLADGTGRVTAAHRKRLDQQVRERVKQHVWPARARALRLAVSHPAPCYADW